VIQKKNHTVIFIWLILLFIAVGCSNQTTDPMSPIPKLSQRPADIGSVKHGWEGQGTRLYDSALVDSAEGTVLKIKGKNTNQADFKIREDNFSQPVFMELSKANVTTNHLILEPLGMALPEGVEITLEYGHSPLPDGVSEDDLRIFLDENGNYTPLNSTVNPTKMEVAATGYSTGIYFLGAFNANRQLKIIEGEYGVRREKLIRSNKGGQIALGLGSFVEIPKNALNQNTLIGIIASRETIQGTSETKAFAFTPHGTHFNIPVKIVLAWPEMVGQVVQLYYFNPTTNEWELTDAGVWDYKKATVTVEVRHFSRYAIAFSR
jgi:hypothetical protein